MLNLGIRYDLDLPAFDTRGRLATFDPELYEPRQLVVRRYSERPTHRRICTGRQCNRRV